jgi:hypothetical protein
MFNWPSLDSIDLQHTQNRMVMKKASLIDAEKGGLVI